MKPRHSWVILALFLGASAPRSAGAAEPRADLAAWIERGWAAHQGDYRQIVGAPSGTDRLGGLLLPAFETAEARGVDTLPLVLDLLLAQETPAEAVPALGRRLLAVARGAPERLPAPILEAALEHPGAADPARVAVAQSRAALAEAATGPQAVTAGAWRLLALITEEGRRAPASEGVVAALLEGVVVAGRRAGDERAAIIERVSALARLAGVHGARVDLAVGEIGGPGAEAAVLRRLGTARSDGERRWALHALARVGTERAWGIVAAYASDPESSGYLREAAIGALGRFGADPRVAAALESIAQDPARRAGERQRAVDTFREALWRLPPGSPEAAGWRGRLERLEGLVEPSEPARKPPR